MYYLGYTPPWPHWVITQFTAQPPSSVWLFKKWLPVHRASQWNPWFSPFFLLLETYTLGPRMLLSQVCVLFTLPKAEWEVSTVALALPPSIYPHGPFLVPFHASVGLLLHVAVLPHTPRFRPIDMFLFLVFFCAFWFMSKRRRRKQLSFPCHLKTALIFISICTALTTSEAKY